MVVKRKSEISCYGVHEPFLKISFIYITKRRYHPTKTFIKSVKCSLVIRKVVFIENKRFNFK